MTHIYTYIQIRYYIKMAQMNVPLKTVTLKIQYKYNLQQRILFSINIQG